MPLPNRIVAHPIPRSRVPADAGTAGPALGGITSLLALVSGTWFPIGDSGVIHDVAQVLPSYWLVQAAHVGVGGSGWGGSGWGGTGWTVIAVWSAVLAWLAARAYRKDTGRV